MASERKQTVSSSFPSSSSGPLWSVFLSFRREDTLKNFEGLDQAGLRTFRDDGELPRGQKTSMVLKGIETSKVAIVILSEKYASSRWCLNELVKILECKRTMGLLVLPVFYNVNPSDVRCQTGSLARTFAKHEEHSANSWRAALTELANLSGYDLHDVKGYETRLIQKIVQYVLFKLKPVELNIDQTDAPRFPSSTHCWHVFLSFRGVDTRKKFTGHLYMALKQVGVQAFIDDDGLPRGKDVMLELHKAIQESKILIVIFSKNYASSEWCLDELVKILEQNRTTGQLVFPIFYDARPSDVREQNGCFAEAFKRHEECFLAEMGKVRTWRAALTEAAKLAGWDLENAWNGDEPRLIQNVVEKVLLRVNPKHLYVSETPVGTDSRVRKINSLLRLGSNDVRVIGIHGMGGIGKTTIAKAVYNSVFQSFEASCFLANVKANDLVSLQELLLSEILGNGNIKVGLVERGINLMKERFISRRILVVLDDADNLNQVKALGEKHWFGSGSIIMITTRDVSLLNQIQVDEQYDLQGLTEKESLELFSWHAFRKSTPLNDYKNISESIISYAGGLPLALEVLGSYLVGKTMLEWESAFKKIQEIPHNQIQKILRISYDSLDDDKVKDVFLGIACFFVGMNKDAVINILDACGFFPEIGIRNLMDRCLLKIEKENDLWMHDHLRDMGREIVREECPKMAEKRSRLWLHTEVCDVLRKKKGTKAIEGVVLDLTTLKQRHFGTEAFERMDSLRLLLINNVNLTGNFENVFEELRWLHWHYCPLTCLPADFHPEKLVILDLQYNKVNKLWHDIKFLENLKILNLSYSCFLETTPDFTGVPKLERLLLEGCASLTNFHPSIGLLEVLVYLNLKECKKLRNLPSSISNIKSLECLDLDGCLNLQKLPDSIGHLQNLKLLSVKECNKVSLAFPTRLFSLAFHTRFVPPTISGLCSLTKFNLHGCNLSDEDIPDDIGSLSSLKALHLDENCFHSLPSTLCHLSNLEELWLVNCKSLQSVPEFPPNLRRLHADDCTSMEKLPNLSNLNHLEGLYLRNCSKLAEIHGLENLNSIRSVRMESCCSLGTTFADNLVHKYTELGKNFQFFLPRSEIPDWFVHQGTGSSISFRMPFDVKNRVLGMTLWVVYSSKDDTSMRNYCPCATIRNKTHWADMKRFCLYSDIAATNEEHSWVTYIPWTNFDYSIEGGERFKVSIKKHPAVEVKECGIYTKQKQSRL